MKSTKVQTLGELCMRGTANWWAGPWAICSRRLLAGVARGECFRGSLAGFTHFIRLLPVQSLLRCFKGSHVHFLHSTVLRCLGYIARLRFTLRWEGMAASTNCSSNVNCCATLRTYLAQLVVFREQISTLTEERNSRTACSSKVN